MDSDWTQTSNSTGFWPENPSAVDDFWLEALREDKIESREEIFLGGSVVDPAYQAPPSPPSFPIYQDDHMDFWLNVLMEAGQMQSLPEF